MAAGLSLEDAQKLIAEVTGGRGSGSGNGGVSGDPTNVFYTDMEGNYYTFQDGKRVDIPDSMVKDNDLVHNEYVEGSQRRRSNQGADSSVQTIVDDYVRKKEEYTKNLTNNSLKWWK